MRAGFPGSLDSMLSARALGRTGILRSFVQWPAPQTHTHSPTHLGERYHMLKGANPDSRSVMSHQGSPVWKILPYQQHQKLQSIHVLPHKPLWDRHNGKWEGQPENHFGGSPQPLEESDYITVCQEMVFWAHGYLTGYGCQEKLSSPKQIDMCMWHHIQDGSNAREGRKGTDQRPWGSGSHIC